MVTTCIKVVVCSYCSFHYSLVCSNFEVGGLYSTRQNLLEARAHAIEAKTAGRGQVLLLVEGCS